MPARLAVVVASGVALTLFGPGHNCGGMGHYIRARRERGVSTTHFAAPAIVSLVEMMKQAGSAASALEEHIYGGAVSEEATTRDAWISSENVKVAEELLANLEIPLAGKDVGGTRGLKRSLIQRGVGHLPYCIW